MSASDFEPGADFFAALPSPAQPGVERRLRIGPFSILLSELDPALTTPLEDRYLGFVDPGSGDSGLRLPVRCAGVPHFLARYGDAQGMYMLKARPADGKILIYAHDFAGWFADPGENGLLAVCAPGWKGLETPLENFLRVYCAWRATERRGFLLHGASIVRDGRAYVFFGHSGAGKTTVSTLSREMGFVLSDDLTLITHEAEGYLAHSVPFRGLYRERVVAERKTFPLAGFYHLVQAPRNKVARLPHARAVAQVLSCLPFVNDRLLPKDPVQMMELLNEGLRRIPVFQLEFTRSADFWEPVLRSV